MKGIAVLFADVGKVPLEVIYGAAKKLFHHSGGADRLYSLGAGWDCSKAIALLERDLNTTVLTNVPADVWATLKFFDIREPIKGCNRLLEEMP